MRLLADFNSFAICTLSLALPLIVIYLVWQFFRGAVQSGVSRASPKPGFMTPPPHPPAAVDEARIREIVRDEVRRIVSERKSQQQGQDPRR